MFWSTEKISFLMSLYVTIHSLDSLIANLLIVNIDIMLPLLMYISTFPLMIKYMSLPIVPYSIIISLGNTNNMMNM